MLKRLLTGNVLSGRQIAESLRLPLPILGELLRRLKTEQLVVYKAASAVNDYDYELTPSGFERASRLFQHSGYHGPAPVPLGEYVASVTAQSPSHATPTMADLRRALAGLLIDSSRGPDWRGDLLDRGFVPVRCAGERQNEHCRATDFGIQPDDLDSARDRRRR